LKFVIRDDDTCAMTRPEELEFCYSEIWDEIPICLSVTPFRLPLIADRVTGELEEPHDEMAPMPLAGNPELVEFLKDGIARGRLHAALHGYNHDMPGGLPEYVAGSDLARKTLEGRQYVESLLGCRISTFVPPNNSLSKEGYAAVVGAGLNVVNRQNYSRMNLGALRPEALIELAVTLRYSLHNRLGRQDEYSVRSYPRYKQAPYFTAGPSISLLDLQDRLRACPKEGGVFVLATHYHAFGRQMKSGETIGAAMSALIEEARRIPKVEFVTYNELW